MDQPGISAVDRPDLEEMFLAAREAGIRLPFTVEALRQWAAGLAISDGASDGSATEFGLKKYLHRVPGEILNPEFEKKIKRGESGRFAEKPGASIEEKPKPRIRAQLPEVLEPEADALNLPVPGTPAKRGNKWKAVGHTEPEEVAKRSVAAARAREKEKKEAELAKRPGISLVKSASNSANTAAKNSAADLEKAIAARDQKAAQLKKGEGFDAPWVMEMLDEAVVEARAAHEEVLKHQEVANAARARAEANSKSARITNAEARKAQEARAAADAAREMVGFSLKKAVSALNARDTPVKDKKGKLGPVPRPPFSSKITKARMDGFNNPPPGYRIATARELYERVGNSPMFSGMHIAEDPDSYKPFVKFSPFGLKTNEYSIPFQFRQERAKWRRVERLRKIEPQLRAGLMEDLRSPDISPEGLQNALAALITMETGARPGNVGNESFVKDKRHPGYREDRDDPTRVKHPTYGSTTLLNEHAEIVNGADGKPAGVRFRFLGKSGVMNDIVSHNAELARHIAHIKENGKPGDRLLPKASSQGMAKVLGRYGFDEKDVSSPAESGMDEDAVDEAESETGKFKIKDLRTLKANTLAPDYFQKIMDSYNRLPEDMDEFLRWMDAAVWASSQELGNEFPTFHGNYLSMLPFMEVIHAMIEREKKKSRNRGPTSIEDYWPYGIKVGFPGKAVPEGHPGAIVSAATDRKMRTVSENGHVISLPNAEMMEVLKKIKSEPKPPMEELMKKYIDSVTIAEEPEEVPEGEVGEELEGEPEEQEEGTWESPRQLSEDEAKVRIILSSAADLRTRALAASAVLRVKHRDG